MKGKERLKIDGNTLFRHACMLLLVACVAVLVLSLLAFPAWAQADQQQRGPSASANDEKQAAVNSAADADTTDAQILQELDQMRARIQELESRLKQRSSAPTAKASAEIASTPTNQLL